MTRSDGWTRWLAEMTAARNHDPQAALAEVAASIDLYGFGSLVEACEDGDEIVVRYRLDRAMVDRVMGAVLAGESMAKAAATGVTPLDIDAFLDLEDVVAKHGNQALTNLWHVNTMPRLRDLKLTCELLWARREERAKKKGART